MAISKVIGQEGPAVPGAELQIVALQRASRHVVRVGARLPGRLHRIELTKGGIHQRIGRRGEKQHAATREGFRGPHERGVGLRIDHDERIDVGRNGCKRCRLPACRAKRQCSRVVASSIDEHVRGGAVRHIQGCGKLENSKGRSTRSVRACRFGKMAGIPLAADQSRLRHAQFGASKTAVR